jgi:hypothetical protein
MTHYQGVLNTLAAARSASFRGRFVYLNSGVTNPSLAGGLLNLLKRNTLIWRRHVEDEIRASGLDYTIIRVGFLLNHPGGQRAVEVSQTALPLLQATESPAQTLPRPLSKQCSTHRRHAQQFDIVWGKGNREDWGTPFSRLKPDLWGLLQMGPNNVLQATRQGARLGLSVGRK